MAEKENNQRRKSTIDKYFEKTAKGFDVWVEGNEDDRSYLQIAAECTGDADEDGNQGFDFHIAYNGKTAYLADGIAQVMQRDKFLRTIVITAARRFLMDK